MHTYVIAENAKIAKKIGRMMNTGWLPFLKRTAEEARENFHNLPLPLQRNNKIFFVDIREYSVVVSEVSTSRNIL